MIPSNSFLEEMSVLAVLILIVLIPSNSFLEKELLMRVLTVLNLTILI